MVIAWHILNKATYPQDTRFSKNVFVVAPGLTVKSRLAVLGLSHAANYYEASRCPENTGCCWSWNWPPVALAARFPAVSDLPDLLIDVLDAIGCSQKAIGNRPDIQSVSTKGVLAVADFPDELLEGSGGRDRVDGFGIRKLTEEWL
jgi:hypothetical protein